MGNPLELTDYLSLLGLEANEGILTRCRRVEELSLASIDLEADTRWFNQDLEPDGNNSCSDGEDDEVDVAGVAAEIASRATTRGPAPVASARKVAEVGAPSTSLARQSAVLAGYGDSIAMQGYGCDRTAAAVDPETFHYKVFSVLENEQEHEPWSYFGEERRKDLAEAAEDSRRKLMDYEVVDPVQRMVGRLVRHVRRRQQVLEVEKRRLLEPLFSRLSDLKTAHTTYFREQSTWSVTAAAVWENSLFGRFESHLEDVCRWLYVFSHNGSR